MMPQLRLYEPPLDDGEEDETPPIPRVEIAALNVCFGFAVMLLFGSSVAALLWCLAELFVP